MEPLSNIFIGLKVDNYQKDGGLPNLGCNDSVVKYISAIESFYMIMIGGNQHGFVLRG